MLLAEVSALAHPPRVVAVFRRADLPRGMRPVTLALWQIGDPGNVGTLLRAADAFDAGVALSDGCADPTGPKALRASMGAVFRVPLSGFDEPRGKRVALVPGGGTPLPELEAGGEIVLLLGAEREGLPADVLERWPFDPIYGAWWERIIPSGGKQALAYSVRRYLRAISGPPDEG